MEPYRAKLRSYQLENAQPENSQQQNSNIPISTQERIQDQMDLVTRFGEAQNFFGEEEEEEEEGQEVEQEVREVDGKITIRFDQLSLKEKTAIGMSVSCTVRSGKWKTTGTRLLGAENENELTNIFATTYTRAVRFKKQIESKSEGQVIKWKWKVTVTNKIDDIVWEAMMNRYLTRWEKSTIQAITHDYLVETEGIQVKRGKKENRPANKSSLKRLIPLVISPSETAKKKKWMIDRSEELVRDVEEKMYQLDPYAWRLINRRMKVVEEKRMHKRMVQYMSRIYEEMKGIETQMTRGNRSDSVLKKEKSCRIRLQKGLYAIVYVSVGANKTKEAKHKPAQMVNRLEMYRKMALAYSLRCLVDANQVTKEASSNMTNMIHWMTNQFPTLDEYEINNMYASKGANGGRLSFLLVMKEMRKRVNEIGMTETAIKKKLRQLIKATKVGKATKLMNSLNMKKEMKVTRDEVKDHWSSIYKKRATKQHARKYIETVGDVIPRESRIDWGVLFGEPIKAEDFINEVKRIKGNPAPSGEDGLRTREMKVIVKQMASLMIIFYNLWNKYPKKFVLKEQRRYHSFLISKNKVGVKGVKNIRLIVTLKFTWKIYTKIMGRKFSKVLAEKGIMQKMSKAGEMGIPACGEGIYWMTANEMIAKKLKKDVIRATTDIKTCYPSTSGLLVKVVGYLCSKFNRESSWREFEIWLKTKEGKNFNLVTSPGEIIVVMDKKKLLIKMRDGDVAGDFLAAIKTYMVVGVWAVYFQKKMKQYAVTPEEDALKSLTARTIYTYVDDMTIMIGNERGIKPANILLNEFSEITTYKWSIKKAALLNMQYSDGRYKYSTDTRIRLKDENGEYREILTIKNQNEGTRILGVYATFEKFNGETLKCILEKMTGRMAMIQFYGLKKEYAFELMRKTVFTTLEYGVENMNLTRLQLDALDTGLRPYVKEVLGLKKSLKTHIFYLHESKGGNGWISIKELYELRQTMKVVRLTTSKDKAVVLFSTNRCMKVIMELKEKGKAKIHENVEMDLNATRVRMTVYEAPEMEWNMGEKWNENHIGVDHEKVAVGMIFRSGWAIGKIIQCSKQFMIDRFVILQKHTRTTGMEWSTVTNINDKMKEKRSKWHISEIVTGKKFKWYEFKGSKLCDYMFEQVLSVNSNKTPRHYNLLIQARNGELWFAAKSYMANNVRDPRCILGCDEWETQMHVLCGCNKYSKKRIERHNTIERILGRNVKKILEGKTRVGIEVKLHKMDSRIPKEVIPEEVLNKYESDCHRKGQKSYTKPDIVIVFKRKRKLLKVVFIEVAVVHFSNMQTTFKWKKTKYKEVMSLVSKEIEVQYVFGIVFGIFGLLLKESIEELSKIGYTKNDLKKLHLPIIKTLSDSVKAFRDTRYNLKSKLDKGNILDDTPDDLDNKVSLENMEERPFNERLIDFDEDMED